MNAAWREVSGHWKHHVAKSPEDSRRAREHAKRNLHHALHHVFNHSYHVGEDGGIRRVWWGAGGDEDDGSITLLDSASWSQLAFVWGVPTLFAYVAYRKRSVDWTGAVGGWLVAFSCCLAGFQYMATLLFFFVSSTILTRYGSKRKRKLEDNYKEGGQRNWLQVPLTRTPEQAPDEPSGRSAASLRPPPKHL